MQINMKKRIYPASDEVGKYGKEILNAEYLTDFVYIPYLDALYSDKYEIVIYSLNPMYQINDSRYFEYFQILQEDYSQHMVLSELNYEGAWGLNVPVPIEYLGNDDSFELASFILDFYKDEIDEVNGDTTEYSYLLNENVDSDWKISHTALSQTLSATDLKLEQEDVDFLKFAKIMFNGDMKVRYTNRRVDEVIEESSKGLKVDVTMLELKMLKYLIEKAAPSADVKAVSVEVMRKKNPALLRKPLTLDKDVIVFPTSGVVVLDFVNVFNYCTSNITDSAIMTHDFNRFIEDVLPRIQNCEILITNKKKFKRNQRFIALDK